MKTKLALFCALLLTFSATVHSQTTQRNDTHPGAAARKHVVTPVLSAQKPSDIAEDDYGDRFSFSSGAVFHCDWSPDGTWIAYEDNGDIFVKAARGGNAVNLTTGIDGYCYLPSFAPDNSGIAFTVYYESQNTCNIVFVDLAGTTQTTLIASAVSAVWSHNGRYVVYRDYISSDLRLYDYQAQTTKTLVAAGGTVDTEIGYGASCFSVDDTFVIASLVDKGVQRLFSVPLDGSAKTQLTFTGGNHDYPDLSPDGKYVLFTVTDANYMFHQWALERETGRAFPLFDDLTVDTFMGKFSESSDRFCYIYGDNNVYEVYVKDFEVPDETAVLELISPNGGEKLIAGGRFAIKWSASSSITELYLEYSTDNGATWTMIAGGVKAVGGSYDWTPPAADSARCLVRISNSYDMSVSDTSDAVFTIAQPYLRVVSPNGGETWNVGTTQNITWEARNVATVKIELSTDSGATWETVATGVNATTQSFKWTIPDRSSTTCKIRITDEVGSGAQSSTYGRFAIQQPTNTPFVRIVTPNGGEKWEAGSTQIITWEARNVQAVKLELSRDGGANWMSIASNVTASDQAFSWMVPTTLSETCRVRITNVAGTVSSTSYADFAIVPKAFIKVTSPNGGETLIAGSTVSIQWDFYNIDTFTILYTTGLGQWIPIVENLDINILESSGAYNWAVPDVESTTCRVRVADASGSGILDVSDATFAIQKAAKQSIVVTSPNGGETLTAGSTVNIAWKAVGVAKVNLSYSVNNGSTWASIQPSMDAATGLFVWTVPDAKSTTCLVRASDATDSGLMDISDSPFSIVSPPDESNIAFGKTATDPSLTDDDITSSFILSANSVGQTVMVDLGNTYSVNAVMVYTGGRDIGAHTQTSLRGYAVEVSVDNARWEEVTVIHEIGMTNVSDGGYDFSRVTFPAQAARYVRIRILEVRTSAPNIGEIMVFGTKIRAIAISFPVGGETLKPGDSFTIKWEASGIAVFDIEFSANGGTSWSTVKTGFAPSTGASASFSYIWTVPDKPTNSAIIRILDNADRSYFRQSPAFTIKTASTALLTLLSPNGGETLEAGKNQYIAWTSSGIANIKIEYSVDGGTIWKTIEESFPAANEGYSWQIPGLETSRGLIRIQGTASDNTVLKDVSDSFFSIVPATVIPMVTVLHPNGGESWIAGQSYDITWEAAGFATVAIWYTPDAGINWYTITDTVPAAQGYYSWQVPSDLDIPECYIAVGNADDISLYDVSDGYLTIAKPVTGAVIVHAPIGGDVLVGGTQFTIKWEAINVSLVDIYFTIDGAQDHLELIARNVDSSLNKYVWTVPSDKSYESSNCYVIFFDSATQKALDANLSPFAISIPTTGNPIELVAPVGGLELDAGTQTEIKWTAQNTVTAVAIHYSTDSGTSWSIIASRVDAAAGSFLWTIPAQAVSNTCLVRVVNVDNIAVSAVSQAFTVLPDPANTNAFFALDTDFVKDGIQERPVIGIKPNARVGFAAYSVDWRTAGSYIITLKWNADKAIFKKNLSLLTMKAQQMTINGVEVTLPTVGNILSTDGGATDYTVIQEEAGVFKARIARTSIGVSRQSSGLLYVGIFETTAAFVANDSLAVSVGISVTDKLGRVTDLSPRLFKVYGEPDVRSLTLTSPNGGETVYVGSQQTVSWQSDGVADVKIEYSADNGGTWNTIIARTEAPAGSYLWTVPDIQESAHCLVRVIDADKTALTDTSDGVFGIVKQSFIQVTSPVNGASWKEGSTQTIAWTALNVTNVAIDYSTDGGGSWTAVASGVNAALNSYNWKIPEGESESCKVRIRDAANADLFAISEGLFSIATSDYITVTAPAQGDTWTVNSAKQITWQMKGVQTVTIDVSFDDGLTWPDRIADAVSALTGSFTWTVPDTPATQCRIRIVDPSRSDKVSFVTEAFTIMRPELTLDHTPPATALENTAIDFAVTVTSTAEIKSVILYYRQMGLGEGVVSAPMQKKQAGNYTYTLPTGIFIAPGIEYYIVATDVNSMEARSPIDIGVHVINARVSGVKATTAVSGGSEQTAYRLISIPLELKTTSIVDQLRNSLPTGAMGTEWRLFRYPAGASEPKEYPNIEGFAPGRAFWLISTSSFTLTAPEGTTVPTDEPFQMTLKSGWNDIANPWMFTINWSNIENRSNARLSTLYSYDGKWSDPTAPPDVMEPWKGYAVRNLESSDRIVFFRTGTETNKPSSFTVESWRVSIRASAGEALDTANHVGVRLDAREDYDRYDHVEPPEVGKYVSVYFPHDDWSICPYAYTVDFRPPAETLVWDFTVKTNIAGATVDVELTGLDNLPADASVRLFDCDLERPIALDGAGFSFLAGKGVTERHFTLEITGVSEPEPDTTVTLPAQFVTARAFPNPFNPQTTLQYELSEAGRVRILVFNSLGQMVREYQPGFMETGVHEIVFDAVGLTSGLYIYRIEAGRGSATGKMLYMK